MVEVIRSKLSLAFAGAGVPTPLGYPSWPALITRLAEETRTAIGGEGISDASGGELSIAEALSIPDGLVAAAIFRHNLGQRYADIMRETFGPREGVVGSIHDLVGLPFTHILTSNYDPSLELAFTQSQLPFCSLCLCDDAAAGDFLRRLRERIEPRCVLHLHGVWDRPQTIILTENDYAQLYDRATITTFWSAVTTLHSCVFFGFSFLDNDLVGQFWNRARRQMRDLNHYAVVRIEKSESEAAARTFHKEKYGIEPVFFDKLDDRFTGYDDLLRKVVADVHPTPVRTFDEPAEGVVEVRPVASPIAPEPDLLHLPNGAEPIFAEDIAALEGLTASNLRKRRTGDLE